MFVCNGVMLLWLHYFQANNIWQSGYGACYVIFQYNNNIAGIVGERINIMSRPPMPVLCRRTYRTYKLTLPSKPGTPMNESNKSIFAKVLQNQYICNLKAASGDKVRSEMSGASAVTGDPVLLARLAASG